MFILSSPKLEIRAKQFLLGGEGGGRGKGKSNDPNIVSTYE
jgi:hypothetical protein